MAPFSCEKRAEIRFNTAYTVAKMEIKMLKNKKIK